jgi:hypothetical protein
MRGEGAGQHRGRLGLADLGQHHGGDPERVAELHPDAVSVVLQRRLLQYGQRSGQVAGAGPDDPGPHQGKADDGVEGSGAGQGQAVLDEQQRGLWLGALRIARTAIPPEAIAAEARRQGISRTGPELHSRAGHIRSMARKTTKPERLAVLAAELAQVEAERQRLRNVRRYNEVVSFALDEDLARRAGLAVAGKPVALPDLSKAWDAALAPLREIWQSS